METKIKVKNKNIYNNGNLRLHFLWLIYNKERKEIEINRNYN